MRVKRFRPRTGTTMVEILIVLACTITIMGVGAAYLSTSAQRTNKESVQNELQIYASGIADAFYDIGVPTIDPTDSDTIAEFERYLKNLQSDYIAVRFDMDSIRPTVGGFEVSVIQPLDAYNSQYKCWFTTMDGYQKYVLIASGGPNGVLDDAGYPTGDYGDDIVAICRPKG